MTDGEHLGAKQDLLGRLCFLLLLLYVPSFKNASKNRLVTRVLTQQKLSTYYFKHIHVCLATLSILLTWCTNSDARYRTKPASKEHTVFHMYGTQIPPVGQHVLQLLLLPTSTNRMHHMRCQ